MSRPSWYDDCKNWLDRLAIELFEALFGGHVHHWIIRDGHVAEAKVYACARCTESFNHETHTNPSTIDPRVYDLVRFPKGTDIVKHAMMRQGFAYVGGRPMLSMEFRACFIEGALVQNLTASGFFQTAAAVTTNINAGLAVGGYEEHDSEAVAVAKAALEALRGRRSCGLVVREFEERQP